VVARPRTGALLPCCSHSNEAGVGKLMLARVVITKEGLNVGRDEPT
jgi:hypothetical protein